MENNSFLEKKIRVKVIGLAVVVLVSIMLLLLYTSRPSQSTSIKIAISPYQDIAMIVNIKNLNLEEKYGTSVDFYSMNWEEIMPAVTSAGQTVDIGFGSLTEFLTQYSNLNKNTKDPILFVYPAYIYKGGGFMTFNNDIPEINKESVLIDSILQEFLSYKIGAQKNSIYEMIIFSLAKKANVPYKNIKLLDVQLNDGFLAAQGKNPDIDITSVGLTQITEGLKHGGRLVLEMENIGFADITGFICKKSTYEKNKEAIENVIRMWFDCTRYVLSDIDNNSAYSRDYLDKNAATQYTIEQYKTALGQEYFPITIPEAEKQIVSDSGIFPYKRICADIIDYLKDNRIIVDSIPCPEFIGLKEVTEIY